MRRNALIVVLIATLLLSFAAWASQMSAIAVQAAQEVGPLPFLFRSGMFAYGAEEIYPAYLQQKFFQDHKPGAIEVTSDHVTYDSQSFDDMVLRLHAEPEYDAFLKRSKDHGGKVVIAFFGIPRWLSSYPDDTTPVEPGQLDGRVGRLSTEGLPSSGPGWSRRSSITITISSASMPRIRCGGNLTTAAGTGTEEEFFELYRYTVIGARRADPKRCGWRSICFDLEQYLLEGS